MTEQRANDDPATLAEAVPDTAAGQGERRSTPDLAIDEAAADSIDLSDDSVAKS